MESEIIQNNEAMLELNNDQTNSEVHMSKEMNEAELSSEFYTLIQSDDLEKIQEFLHAHPGVMNILDDKGLTPLHYAQNAEIAKILLDRGANPNAIDIKGNTPLHYARNSGIVTHLIRAGADANAIDINGNTPLHYAQNSEIAKILLEHGTNPNAASRSGGTPLHRAQNSEIAKILLEYGADVNALDIHGITPLYRAQDSGVVTTLITAGADVKAVNRDGDTLLHRIYDSGLVTPLITAGADVNAVNTIGDTPLHLARGDKVAAELIAYGANCNTTNIRGKNPIEDNPYVQHVVKDMHTVNSLLHKASTHQRIKPTDEEIRTYDEMPQNLRNKLLQEAARDYNRLQDEALDKLKESYQKKNKEFNEEEIKAKHKIRHIKPSELESKISNWKAIKLFGFSETPEEMKNNRGFAQFPSDIHTLISSFANVNHLETLRFTPTQTPGLKSENGQGDKKERG